MLYYLIFMFAMPVLVYIDYSLYKKRLEGYLSAQPDHGGNTQNYSILFDKLCRHQKKTSITVCIVACLLALMLFIFSAADAFV